ncbi:PREDICTED: paxillin-like [Dufourea novaeangliae]|uniref:paxillin-like n=1 Tax=Dufourea novaeangliae TaxID=178035 RepID=UPI0007674E52|nr:PREDICTED: paxillin-like [Dufourea novaeangliae]
MNRGDLLFRFHCLRSVVVATESVSHSACFSTNLAIHVCCFSRSQDCRQKFQGGSFFDHEGLPYCETHYHAKRGSLCAGCHKPITGRCITAMFRKFHPEHFVCAFCLKQLNKGTFKEQNDKPYCHGCFDKLFG